MDTHVRDGGIAFHLEINGGNDKDQEARRHNAKDHPGKLFSLQYISKRKDHGHRYDDDADVFHHIGEIVGIFHGLGRVGAKKAAPIGAQLLDSNHGRRRATADMHRISLHGYELILTLEGHRRAVERKYRRHDDGQGQ